MALDLTRFDTITFDCYGTLIDWETGILACFRQVLGLRPEDEARALELYSRIEPQLQAEGYKPYRDVLREVMIYMASQFGKRLAEGEADALPYSVRNWLPFPDTIAALQRLKTKYRLGIISNIDDDLFTATSQHLQVPFDFTVTAQQVGAYKPSLKNFELAERVGKLDRARWLHAAESLYHDVAPSKALGIANVWVNRRQGKAASATKSVTVVPDREVPDLKSLADAAGV